MIYQMFILYIREREKEYKSYLASILIIVRALKVIWFDIIIY